MQLSSRWDSLEPPRAFHRSSAGPWDRALVPAVGDGAGTVGAQRILSLAEEGAERASSPCQPRVPGATAGWVTQVAASSVTLWSGIVCAHLFLCLKNRIWPIFGAWLMLLSPSSCAWKLQPRLHARYRGKPNSSNFTGNGAGCADPW